MHTLEEICLSGSGIVCLVMNLEVIFKLKKINWCFLNLIILMLSIESILAESRVHVLRVISPV